MTNKKISFSIENFNFVEESSNSQFATAKVQAFASGPNRHDMYCSDEVLQKTASSLYSKPILYNVNKMFQDFNTHADPENTLIAGFVSPNSVEFTQLEDGRLGLNVFVRLWKRYAPKFMEIIKKETNKKVSVEMDLLDSEERSDGLLEMKNFEYTGICVLGDIVTEASPGANLQMVSFAKEKEDYEQAYKSEFSMRYNDIDMSIPPTVKKNVELGLSLYKQYNKGGNSVSLASARFLAKSEKANHEKIRHISKSLKAKKFNNMVQDPPSEEYISWLLYGGIEGKEWSEKIEKELDLSDSSHLSYFNIDSENGGKENKIVEDEKEVMAEKPVEEEMAVEKPETKEEEDKEEKQETPEQEKEEEKKEKMSLDANLDLAVILAMLEDETEAYAKVKAESEKEPEQMNYAVVACALYSKMEKMCNGMAKMAELEEKNKAYMAENEELKKFKADVEERQFKYEVDACMSEIKNSTEMPQEEFEALVEESKKFSLETIDAWKNLAKAKAFSFAVKGKKSKDEPVRYGFPWGSGAKQEKKSIWS